MNNINSDKWNNIIKNQSNSTIYHLSEWGKILSDINKHKLFYLMEDDGIFPLALVQSKIFGNRLISLPFADYGGPLATNIDVARALIAKALITAIELKVDFIEIRCPDTVYFTLLEEAGFVKREDYFTYILPINKGQIELWKCIGEKNRNMVRKAEKNNIGIIFASSKQELNKFYILYLKTMKRLGSPPHSYLYFEKIWDLFYPDNLIIPMAYYKNICIAGGLFFQFKGTLHHAYSCSLKEYLTLGTNDFVQWFMIKWGYEHGLKELDFGRTRENAGNVLFKKRWGGKQVSMPYFYKFYKGEFKVRQEIKYIKLSKLWRIYMPELLAKSIGPYIVGQIG